jgi:hypothetical protein
MKDEGWRLEVGRAGEMEIGVESGFSPRGTVGLLMHTIAQTNLRVSTKLFADLQACGG